MTNGQFDGLIDIEVLRKHVIEMIGAAYFSGIGPTALEIEKAKKADADELTTIARRWGVL